MLGFRSTLYCLEHCVLSTDWSDLLLNDLNPLVLLTHFNYGVNLTILIALTNADWNGIPLTQC